MELVKMGEQFKKCFFPNQKELGERSEASDSERRKYKRARAIIDATFLPDPEWPNFDGNTSDITEAGIKCVTKIRLPLGAETLTTFNLPGYEQMVLISAVVVWTKRHAEYYEVGIEFTYVNEKDKQALRRYVEQNARTNK